MYLNYRNFSMEFREETGAFRFLYTPEGETQERDFLQDGHIRLLQNGRLYDFSGFQHRKMQIVQEADYLIGHWDYSGSAEEVPDTGISFRLSGGGITVEMMSRARLRADGLLVWGEEPERSTFGIRRHGEAGNILRSACGPAVSSCDDALFDRLTDRVLGFDSPGDFRVGFDWKKKAYRFDYADGIDCGREFSFRICEHYCRDKFHIPYVPIRKTHGFETPPVGWMTWYALQFDTCEQTVLENADRLKKLFGPWSPKLCLWVDWEWNHCSWDANGIPGVDPFTPRPDVYPNGLAPVAGAIRERGLIPALWMGPTNDGRLTRAFQEHPDWVLGEKKEWCGRYWIDPTHPEVLEEYIPAVFRQALAWGYEMLKWDCLPATLWTCDLFHDRLYNRSISSEQAVRGLVRAARETVGPDVYMLSCSGEADREVGFAMDCFSAARIGGDVFAWEKFIHSALRRVYHCYAWHNVTLYADADNLVLREEFNTPAQARSRVSFYGLAGLPVTIGDDLRKLPAERCDLLRRLMPVADIHPAELEHKLCGDAYSMQNLAVCREFGSWNVVCVTNLRHETLRIAPHLRRDFHLAGERFAVYDYWNRRFLGIHAGNIAMELAPTDSAVLRITPLGETPVIIHTSRHITQGAVELEQVRWADDRLTGSALAAVPGEEWIMVLYLPEPYRFAGIEAGAPAEATVEDNLLTVVFHPENAETIRWELKFHA